MTKFAAPAILASLPSNVVVSTFRSTAKDSTAKLAILTIDGNDLPMVFSADTTEEARAKAVDYFHNEFQRVPVTVEAEPKEDGRKVKKLWLCHPDLPSIRVLPEEVEAKLDEGYSAGRTFGVIPAAPKDPNADHGNTGKTWYHKRIGDAYYDRKRLEVSEMGEFKRKGYTIGYGPRV